MQSIIRGFAMYHEGTWFKDTDTAKADPQRHQSLFVLEKTEKGPQLHKVKVKGNAAGPAASLDEQFVEVLVEVETTNFNNKPGLQFSFIKGKASAPVRSAA